MTDFTNSLRLDVQKARNDAFVWGVSTWTGYRWAGPADTPESGVEWLNILGTTHDIKVNRGAKRDGLTVALEAGTLQATVYDAAVDPNTNPYIKPGTPMRLVYNGGLGDIPVFTGVLRQVQVTYRGGKPQVFISAIDRVKDLANINRSGVVSGTYTERVADLLGKHGITNEVTGSSGLVLAQNAFDSTLLNHLQLAANTEQGRFFVDKENVVKAYGKNAVASGTPSLWFSDKRLDGPDRRNLVFNPGAYGTTGWSYYAGGGVANRVVLTDDDTFPYSTSAVSINWTTASTAVTGGQYFMTNIGDAEAGKTYSASVWVRVSKKQRMTSLLYAYNSATGFISGAPPVVQVVEANTWTEFKVNGWTAPTNTSRLLIGVYSTAGTDGTVWNVDDVHTMTAAVIEEAPTAGSYFDGNSTTSTWVGAENNSQSIMHVSDSMEYVDIAVAYDSAALVNDIYVNNKTYGLSEELEPLSIETKYGPFRNVTSIATFGAYSEEVDTNFGSELDIESFANDVLAASDAPELRVDRVRWNASKTQKQAASLEVFDKVNVEYTNEAFHIGEDFSVLALEHTITASATEHKWMVDVDLISLGGNN